MFRVLHGVNVECFQVERRRRSLCFATEGLQFRRLSIEVFDVRHDTGAATVLVYRHYGTGKRRVRQLHRTLSLEYVGGHDGSCCLVSIQKGERRFEGRELEITDDYQYGDVVMVVNAPSRGVTKENIAVFGER